MKGNGFRFAVVPAFVLQSDEISASEKLFLASISALSMQDGFVYASNGYFAEVFGVSSRTVQRWLNRLEQAGFISVSFDERGGRRRIFLICDFPEEDTEEQGAVCGEPSAGAPYFAEDAGGRRDDKADMEVRQFCRGGTTKSTRGDVKNGASIQETDNYNNINNNINNKITNKPDKLFCYLPMKDGNLFPVREKDILAFSKIFRCDVRAEVVLMRAWLLENPAKRKTKMRTFMANWLKRAAKGPPKPFDKAVSGAQAPSVEETEQRIKQQRMEEDAISLYEFKRLREEAKRE